MLDSVLLSHLYSCLRKLCERDERDIRHYLNNFGRNSTTINFSLDTIRKYVITFELTP